MERERAEMRVQMGDSCVQDRSTVQTGTTQGKQKREVGEMASRAGTPSTSLESTVLPEDSGFHRAWTCVSASNADTPLGSSHPPADSGSQ